MTGVVATPVVEWSAPPSTASVPSRAATVQAQCDGLTAGFHQSLGRTLRLLQLRLDALAGGATSSGARAELQRLRAITIEALRSLDAVTEAVDLVRLRGLPLDRALRRLTADVARATGACAELRVRGGIEVPEGVRHVLVRTARTLLLDVRRSARATVVVVTLSVRASHAVLEVSDDGVDIAQPVPAASDGYAPSPELVLAAASRQVAFLGGGIEVLRGRPRGVRLRVVVPIDERGRE